MMKTRLLAILAIIIILAGAFGGYTLVGAAGSQPQAQYVTALPFIANGGNGGWVTGINIRNDSSWSQTIEIQFNGDLGYDLEQMGGSRIRQTLYPFATLRYWQGDGHLWAGWLGSVTILSEAPITVVVNESGPNGEFGSYAVQARERS